MKKEINVVSSDNFELPGIPSLPKKRGRPVTGNAKTNAQRQKAYRRSVQVKIMCAADSDDTLSNSSNLILVSALTDYIRVSAGDVNSMNFSINRVLDELKKRYSNVSD